MLSASLPHRLYTSLKELGLHLLPTYEGDTNVRIPKVRIVVAYSGGMDSTMLLDTLAQLRAQFHLEVFAAYYNHQWRPGAPRELPILHKTTESLQVPFIMIEADRSLPKTETVARVHRYKALCRLAADLDAQAVLTAHHADDQIETVLFRILRGTGLDGLVGIQRNIAYDTAVYETPSIETETGSNITGKKKAVQVLRPLLGVAKADIVDYVAERQLRYFDDPSNDNTKIQRNLIRKKILPDLQQHFPHVKNALYKIALLAEGDHEILDKGLDDVWSKVYLSDEKGYYLDSTLFNQLQMPYQRRILKRYFERHSIEVDFQTIEDTLMFIRGEHRQDLCVGLKSLSALKSETPKKSAAKTEPHIHEHYFLSLYKNRLRILHLPESAMDPLKPGAARDAIGQSVQVPIPGNSRLDSLKLKISISEIPEELKVKLSKPAVLKASALLDPNVAYVDLSLFIDGPDKPEAPKPLEFRTRRAGDKFFPMGMPAPMRLKKYLINKGVPRFERESLPLLASGEHVLWLPGHGLSDFVKVSGKPTHRIQVEYCEQTSSAFETQDSDLGASESPENELLAAPSQIPAYALASQGSEASAEAFEVHNNNGEHSSASEHSSFEGLENMIHDMEHDESQMEDEDDDINSVFSHVPDEVTGVPSAFDDDDDDYEVFED